MMFKGITGEFLNKARAWPQKKRERAEPSSLLLYGKEGVGSRQARWQELLAEFNFILEYRAGKTNQVADALCRQGQLAVSYQASALQGSEVSTNIKDQIRDLLTKDPGATYLVQLVEQGNLGSTMGSFTQEGTTFMSQSQKAGSCERAL